MTPRRLATSEKINLSKEFQINEQVQIQQQSPENQAQSSNQTVWEKHPQAIIRSENRREGVCRTSGFQAYRTHWFPAIQNVMSSLIQGNKDNSAFLQRGWLVHATPTSPFPGVWDLGSPHFITQLCCCLPDQEQIWKGSWPPGSTQHSARAVSTNALTTHSSPERQWGLGVTKVLWHLLQCTENPQLVPASPWVCEWLQSF